MGLAHGVASARLSCVRRAVNRCMALCLVNSEQIFTNPERTYKNYALIVIAYTVQSWAPLTENLTGEKR